jgi:hypothetical protein
MADSPEVTSLKINQQGQILDQYRMSIFNLEIRLELLNKMLEEKGIMSAGELEKRWPLYLKNQIGVIGPDGVMEGSCKTTFYDGK